MKKLLSAVTLVLGVLPVLAQEKFGEGSIYHEGWIDFNKNGVKDVYEDSLADIDARIEDLLSQMNLEEKTCQMVTLYGYQRVLQDELPTPEWKEKLWKDGIGAIDEHLNGFRNWGLLSESEWLWPASKHALALNIVQRFFIEETRLGIPVDFTNEGIRGVEAYKATNFPTQLGIGHTWDRELVHEIGRITGREARLLGYTNVYAPILDVGRDQRWGRYEEVYGESPYLVAELGVQMALGLQTDYQVAATGKHFAAYSNNKGAREGMARVDPQMSPHEVENIHLYPWREVIGRAGLLGVMSSYNDYDGIPVQGSKYWLTERLRDDFGFKGYVVSDSDAVEYLHSKHHVSADMKESVRQSVEAGLNVRCTFRTPDSYVLPLRELVEEGKLSMSVIDERVRDILRVKFLVGLFDRPYQTDYEAADREVDGRLNNEIALRASRESIVLLKNEDSLLPIDKIGIRKLAVIGPNADEVSFAHTHYGPLVTESVSVRKGLEEALKGKAEVLYAKGCELVDSNWPDSEILPSEPTKEELRQMNDAVKIARKSDVVIAVLGGGQRTCGENKSRSSLNLPGHQELLLKKLAATGKPVVLVLINGRPLSINWADEHIPAIIEAWYPGSHGGTAVAEVIFGDYNPGGKLTVTFPKTVGQIPFNFPCKPNSQVDGGSGVGPQGWQSRVHGALYDFGYGLSYTTFEYSSLKLSSETISPSDSLKLSFTLKNTGSRKGDEVVQLYVRDLLSSITVYEKQLRGFERVSLEPGESKEISFVLTPKDLSLLDADFRQVVEPGEFEIMIGASSKDIRLSGKLLVDDGSRSANLRVGSDIRSVFPLTIGASEDVTVAVREGKTINSLGIRWDAGTDCNFEILWTNGGGQFLPIYHGQISTGDKAEQKNYTFESVAASEIRVAVNKGSATILSLESDAISSSKLSASFDKSQLDAVRKLCARVFPNRSADIDFILEEGEGDFYSLQTIDDRLCIGGNNVNSLARGLGDYMRDWCKIGTTWYARDKVREPERLPEIKERVERKSLVGNRFFLNYCTYGYSLPWWTWKDWERLIDWMALHGVTLSLANTGQESVWLETWQEFGLSPEQIRAYFTGPAYLPWHRMTNIDAWHGPLPQTWLDAQCELQKKIIERETSLGISPILSSFTGHVPAGLKQIFPEAQISKLNRWGSFDEEYNAWYLNPTDSLFREIQKVFLRKQKEIYGEKCHIYGVDLFNEVNPPSWEPGYLADAARLTYEAISENDPDAVWLQMSWLFWHKRKMWTPERIEAYITPVPKGRLIMLDYYCEAIEVYRQTDNFHGQDFIWSYLGNFGGATMIAGDLADISMKLDRLFAEASGNCVGLGCTLEGLDVNPMMYEYVLDRAWERRGNDKDWVDALADRHFGGSDTDFRAAWQLLCEKVQKQKSGHEVSQIPARPNLNGKAPWNNQPLAYDNRDLLSAWAKLLKSSGSDTPEFRFDCVNWARQCLDNYFTELYASFRSDYKKGRVDALRAKGARMLEILHDVDELVGSDAYFLMGKWVEDARSWGQTAEEKDYFETDSRLLLTCWGQKGRHLTDYANRDWNGLIATYYLPRWEKFIAETEESLSGGKPFDEDAFLKWCNDFEWKWAHSFNKMNSHPSGNPRELSQNLFDEYAPEIMDASLLNL